MHNGLVRVRAGKYGNHLDSMLKRERENSLRKSCDALPLHLVLLEAKQVIAHCSLLLVLGEPRAVYIENGANHSRVSTLRE